MTFFQIASAYFGIANVIIGIVYALFGSAKLSVDGRPLPDWLSFSLRLLFPFAILAAALISRTSASVTGTGTAKTAQPVEGEACQNGPQGDAQPEPSHD